MTGWFVSYIHSSYPGASPGYPDFQFLNHRDGETVRSTGVETSPPDLRASVSLW